MGFLPVFARIPFRLSRAARIRHSHDIPNHPVSNLIKCKSTVRVSTYTRCFPVCVVDQADCRVCNGGNAIGLEDMAVDGTKINPRKQWQGGQVIGIGLLPEQGIGVESGQVPADFCSLRSGVVSIESRVGVTAVILFPAGVVEIWQPVTIISKKPCKFSNIKIPGSQRTDSGVVTEKIARRIGVYINQDADIQHLGFEQISSLYARLGCGCNKIQFKRLVAGIFSNAIQVIIHPACVGQDGFGLRLIIWVDGQVSRVRQGPERTWQKHMQNVTCRTIRFPGIREQSLAVRAISNRLS